ncbi:MAG: hypothetical protein STHCBS139747_002031 [Sporothrix thermara]
MLKPTTNADDGSGDRPEDWLDDWLDEYLEQCSTPEPPMTYGRLLALHRRTALPVFQPMIVVFLSTFAVAALTQTALCS